MISNEDSLEEKALSKVAEMGIASQLDTVESLDVQVKTDPFKAIQGKADAIAIQGEGMVMNKDLRMEQMVLQSRQISLNPLSAACGILELDEPAIATAQVVLTEADLNRAFNSEYLHKKLENLTVDLPDGKEYCAPQEIEFRLPEPGKISLRTQIKLKSHPEPKNFAFTATPKLSPDQQQILLENVEYAQEENIWPELNNLLLEQAKSLLNFQNFEVQGMTLKIHQLDIQPGQILLKGEAKITQIPN